MLPVRLCGLKMNIAVGILKRIGFLLLAALVFVGFVYPFFSEPARYEEKARSMTEARIEEGGVTVEEGYVDECVSEAMKANLEPMFRGALLLAAASALVIFCLSIRPPHDCGGINLFNPLGLVFTALISVLTGMALHALLFDTEIIPGADEFIRFTGSLGEHKLLFVVMLPLVFELVFRGAILSYLEKIHFTAALLIAPVLYAVAAYFMVAAYTRWSVGSTEAAFAAFWVALGIGFVNGVLTWRLRSVIPAVLSHMLLAWAAGNIGAWQKALGASYVLLIVLLGVVLAGFVVLFSFFSKKAPVLAYDFPFTKHHAWMNDWLNGRFRRIGRAKRQEEPKPEEAPAEPAEEAKPEEAPAEPAEEPKPEEAPAEPAEEPKPEEAPAEPAEEAKLEEAPAEPAEESKPEEAPAEPAEEPKPEEAPAEPAEEAEGEA